MSLFGKVLQLLSEADVHFIVVGAYASIAHGSEWVTNDLDVCHERTLTPTTRT